MIHRDDSPEQQRLLEALKHLPALETPADLPRRFLHTRTNEATSGGQSRGKWWPWAVAAAAVVMVGAGWWLDHHRMQVAELKLRTQLETALQDQSAATRIAAVRLAGDSDWKAPKVIAALTRALVSDSSPNVRAAAAQALGQVADGKTFAAAARLSLAHEASPFVHASLLESASRFAIADRNGVLRLLLTLNSLDPTLRAEAEARLHS